MQVDTLRILLKVVKSLCATEGPSHFFVAQVSTGYQQGCRKKHKPADLETWGAAP
jgi:hypothetical protein